MRNRVNKKVAISGYYGFKNTGDEAILYSILQLLRKNQNLEPIVLSNAPEETQKLYNVKAVNRWKIKEVSKTLLRSKFLISGGGSLLQDVTGIKSLLYYLSVIGLAKIYGKKVMFYAQGIGPITTSMGKKLMKFICNKVDLITVRDEASKKLLEQLGVEKPPIRVTVDPVLGIDSEKIRLEKGQEILEQYNIPSATPLIGVSVRDWQDLTEYKKAVAKVSDTLIKNGYQILFIPFHFPGDILACRDIMHYMKEKAFLLKNEVTVEEMFSLIGNLEMMIGMRLHSLIMSAAMAIPMVGISYDPKVDSFLKIVCQPNAGRVEILTEEGLLKNINKVLEDKKNIQEQLKQSVAKLKKDAEKIAAETSYLIDYK